MNQTDTKKPLPFSRFEWLIAWRYLRARRAEGGISVMAWISFIGIMLAVFALIATLGIRSGFRTDFTRSILGANAHVSLYRAPHRDDAGRVIATFTDYDAIADRLRGVAGVVRVAPQVKGQILLSANNRNAGGQVFGQRLADLQTLPLISTPKIAHGSLDNFENGVAIGIGVAQSLGLSVGDNLTFISPDGLATPFGTSPRITTYKVVYIFSVGRYDIDAVRVYLPLDEAQKFFNRIDAVDEFEILVDDPQKIADFIVPLARASAVDNIGMWSWQDANGGYLDALQSEDNVMFILLSILVLIASMNIVSGLIMLVKNKGRDIGILRTMGVSQGSVMRIFFICGSAIGVIGTMAGIGLGCAFIIYIDPIFNAVNYIMGGGVWSAEKFLLTELPAELRLIDIGKAAGLSLSLSFIITFFPARRAARMNPIEALRYE